MHAKVDKRTFNLKIDRILFDSIIDSMQEIKPKELY